MPAGALRLLLLLLLLKLSYVTPMMKPQDGEVQRRLDAAQLGLRKSPPAPVAASHRRAPPFMMDMFNLVSGSGETRRSQKEILEGNVVRSLEANGENKGET